MGKYAATIKYSGVLLILVLVSCSSVSLKKTEPLSHAISSSISSNPQISGRKVGPPTAKIDLCSLSPRDRIAYPHARATQGVFPSDKRFPPAPKLKFPVPSGVLSSGFGYRRGIFHTGLDIKAPKGEDVLACADGEVVFAGSRKGYRRYGRTVLIDHGKDVFTLYAHLSRIHVTAGQKVVRGQKIACVGCTGRATAPHLHLEVRMGDRAFDPYVCFSKSELRRIEVAKGFATSPLGPVRVRRLSARR
jgi:murein DD-endopeptidase MepM/ murein hydrolase activator NlpD